MTHLIRSAFRKLGKSPGFACVAIGTLALGIAANTIIFSLIDSVLLTPPPFPRSDRLVALRCKQPAMSWPVVADFHEYLDWKERTDLFSDVMVYNGFTSLVLSDESGARSLSSHSGTANYLRTLGLRPSLGRDLADADCSPGAAPVALIGHALWQNQFHGDAGIIGRSVKLNGRAVTVVGVLPATFRSVTPSERPVEALLPLAYTRENSPRGQHHLWVYARLLDGVSLEQARARLNEYAPRLQQQHDHQHGIVTMSLAEWSTDWVRPRLVTLMGSVALVLLIACVNLANLQLVRITGRTAEISIKMAIGATRWQVARELLAESLVVGVIGGALGTLLAAGTLWFAEDFIRAQFNTFASLRLGGLALAFSIGLTFLASLASSLVPAWRATSSFEQFMRAIGRSAIATPQQRRLNNLFIVAQVALTLLVLVSAGLLTRSMWRLMTQEKGFAVDNLAIFRVSLSPVTYPEPAKRIQFYNQLLEKIRALPGVSSAAIGDSVPLRSSSNGYFGLPGVSWPKGQEPLADKFTVSPDFFRTFGLAVKRGRDFDATLDKIPAGGGAFPAAVIVNEAFAKKYFGDKDPIGQRIAWDSDGANVPANFTWDVVVGVVSDARLVSLEKEPNPGIFTTTDQLCYPSQYLSLRTTLDPSSLLTTVREQVRSLDADIPLTQVRTMRFYVESELAQRKLITWTIASAAGAALLLAVLGLYSVIAYTVAQQTREIGVRMAIGAEPPMIGRWVLGRGLKLVALGIVLGIGGSFVVGQLLGNLIYGVSSWDLLTYGAVVALLSSVALLACWIPARRASRIDPLVALRAE